MTVSIRDYHRYFPLSPAMRRWGVGVTGAGVATIPAGAPYPPRHHPADHFFDWDHGRVLENLQVVLVTSGGGSLETRATKPCHVSAGMAFLLLPNVWHRYRPDPQTGWREEWIEFAGPVVDELLRAGTFAAASVLRGGAVDDALDKTFGTIHRQVLQEPVGSEPELAASALRVLAVCSRTVSKRPPLSPLQRAVRQAQDYLHTHHAQPVNVEALAAELGVAYSHFRRAFRAQTGFAPWQYVIRLRLASAKRLLSSTSATLDEVAARVGFNSGFHLSLTFKRVFGESPSAWKRSTS